MAFWVCHKKVVKIGFVVAQFFCASENLFGKALSLRVLLTFLIKDINFLKYP